MTIFSTTFLGKGLILVVALGLAAASTVNATVNQTRLTQPQEALQWSRYDAVALTMVEDRRQVDSGINAGSATVMANTARMALRSEPLTAPALRQVGTAKALTGRPDEAMMLMMLSHRISRRELGTTVWLINDSLSRGNVQLMLRYCDEALTTNAAAKEVLLPALISGLFDPALRDGLVQYLRVGRPWMPAMLRQALTSDGNAVAVSKLVIAARGLPRMERFDRIDGQILSLLAAKAQFEQAKSYLRSLRGAGRDVFTEMGIAENTIDPRLGPFGWNLVDQLNYGAMVDMTSGSMLIRVAPDQRAVVAARMLMLSPGRYRLHQRLSKPAGAALAHTQWQMSCLASVPSPRSWPLELRSVFAGERLEVDFEIPPECAAQQLRLVADADYVEGEGQVDISDLGLALLS